MEVSLVAACQGQAQQDSLIAAPIEDLCLTAANLQTISLGKEEVLEAKQVLEQDKITMAKVQEEGPQVSNQEQRAKIPQIRVDNLLALEERKVAEEAIRTGRRTRTSFKTATVENVKNTNLEDFHSLAMRILQVTKLRGALKIKSNII